MPPPPLIEFRNVSKFFGSVIALKDVSFQVESGGVACCLLGDNGAGKSTLIKTLSGVHQPSEGEILIDGQPVVFDSPRDAMDFGIATVYQDLALVPLMSVSRNFFMGREPGRKVLGVNVYDSARANRVAREELERFGIRIRDASQAVGTMSGGERQSLAIARAVYFGAKILILDEPTAALGVRQSANVLKTVLQVRSRGIGVIFITHNVQHATLVGNSFSILNRGRSLGFFRKGEITSDELYNKMAGDARWPTCKPKCRKWSANSRPKRNENSLPPTPSPQFPVDFPRRPSRFRTPLALEAVGLGRRRIQPPDCGGREHLERTQHLPRALPRTRFRHQAGDPASRGNPRGTPRDVARRTIDEADRDDVSQPPRAGDRGVAARLSG